MHTYLSCTAAPPATPVPCRTRSGHRRRCEYKRCKAQNRADGYPETDLVGGNRENLYFSFQEYFEKLGNNYEKWGKVAQSLLGTIYAQKEIECYSIGGKDSMSGTFNDINVVETLISFACATVKIEDIITPEL